MRDLNFSLQFCCSEKYSVTTAQAAETGVKCESETREENICAFKLQVEFSSIYITTDANICVYVSICTHTFLNKCIYWCS